MGIATTCVIALARARGVHTELAARPQTGVSRAASKASGEANRDTDYGNRLLVVSESRDFSGGSRKPGKS